MDNIYQSPRGTNCVLDTSKTGEILLSMLEPTLDSEDENMRNNLAVLYLLSLLAYDEVVVKP